MEKFDIYGLSKIKMCIVGEIEMAKCKSLICRDTPHIALGIIKGGRDGFFVRNSNFVIRYYVEVQYLLDKIKYRGFNKWNQSF